MVADEEEDVDAGSDVAVGVVLERESVDVVLEAESVGEVVESAEVVEVDWDVIFALVVNRGSADEVEATSRLARV